MLLPTAANVLTAFLICVGTLNAKRAPYAVKGRHHVPSAWSRIGPAPTGHLIQLQIGLKQTQFSELEKQLYEGVEEK